MFAWIRKLWHGMVHFFDAPEGGSSYPQFSEDGKTVVIDGVVFDLIKIEYVQERGRATYKKTIVPGQNGLSQAQQHQQFLEEAQAHMRADTERTHADLENLSETQRQSAQDHQIGSDMSGMNGMSGMGDTGMGGGL